MVAFSLCLTRCSFLPCSDLLVIVVGARVYRAEMTVKLAKQKQDLNVTLLKVIEKYGAIWRLSEQLQSMLDLGSVFPFFVDLP
jgi:hypothetical protein